MRVAAIPEYKLRMITIIDLLAFAIIAYFTLNNHIGWIILPMGIIICTFILISGNTILLMDEHQAAKVGVNLPIRTIEEIENDKDI